MSIYLHDDLFVSNKYLTWYYSIIENAKKQDRKDGNYYENHHILPESIFPQFRKEEWNFVSLSAREHFLCHWLLVKFTVNEHKQKMYKALHKMTRSRGKRILSSAQYEIARKYNSLYMRENNPSKRLDVRLKMSESAKKRRASQETKNIMSKNNARYWQGKEGFYKGAKFYNNGVIQKMFFIEDVPEGWKQGRLNAPWNKKSKLILPTLP